MKKPHEIHWKEAKRILQCVWSTIQFGIYYSSGGLLCWLVSLIQIGSMTLMIEIRLQVMFLALVLDPSLGIVINNKLFVSLQQKKSTKQW
jgi:hypothetical protein